METPLSAEYDTGRGQNSEAGGHRGILAVCQRQRAQGGMHAAPLNSTLHRNPVGRAGWEKSTSWGRHQLVRRREVEARARQWRRRAGRPDERRREDIGRMVREEAVETENMDTQAQKTKHIEIIDVTRAVGMTAPRYWPRMPRTNIGEKREASKETQEL